jgi:hypothetical protein
LARGIVLRASVAIWALFVAQLFALADASVALGDAPTVAITSPATGQTVEGTVRIEASATASAGEYPAQISFFDGVNGIGHVDCQSQQSCTGSIEWRATGLSGQHTLTARVETDKSVTATSEGITVTVLSPSPTISIASPSSGATVEGNVAVSVQAATDPSQEDYPTEITVYDGVNDIGHVKCQGQRTCQGQVEWHATGLTGVHALTAKVSTNRNLSVTSTPVDVTVLSPPPKVSITHPSDEVRLGGTIAIDASGSTAHSQSEYPTEIVVGDNTGEIGSIHCQGQQECSGSVAWNTSGLKGVYTLTATIHTSRNREATSAPIYVGGYRKKQHVKVSCRIASFHIRPHRRDHGSCVTYGVPAGTIVVVQYRVAGGAWTSIRATQVRLSSDSYTFNVHNRYPITFQISVLVEANSRYAATRVVLGTVHIA